jgi:hypothetical protein
MTSFSSSGGVMEELIDRVSAIFGSPVLGYTRHKIYRQISLLCLVYLVFFYSYAFAETSYEFEPYTNKSSNAKEKIKTDTLGAGEKYISRDENQLKKLEQSAKAMAEVEQLFDKLEVSIKELIAAKPISEEDEEAILKALAQVDGVLSYAHEQLKSGKEQLSSIYPVTDEEKAKYNSLKVKFMSYMRLANDLKKMIAEKFANVPKRKEK